jgi:hypothetical protein
MDDPRGNMARRFLCRLNLWHRWKTHRVADGDGRYQRCASCGKERDVPTVTPMA